MEEDWISKVGVLILQAIILGGVLGILIGFGLMIYSWVTGWKPC